MLHLLKKLFKKEKAPITESIEINGYRFKVLEPTKMPNIRRVRLFLEEYQRDWGISKDDLLSFLKFAIIESKINDTSPNALAAKIQNIYSVLTTLEAVIKEDYQYKPYLKAASIMILLENEDPNKLDAKIIKQKLQLCESDPEIEAFFLTTIRAFQLSIQKQLDMSVLTSWLPSKNLKHMESHLYKWINSTIYETGNI